MNFEGLWEPQNRTNEASDKIFFDITYRKLTFAKT